jgi:hypothetical protein
VRSINYFNNATIPIFLDTDYFAMNLLFQYLAICWFKNDPSELIPDKAFTKKVIIFYLISGSIVEGLIAEYEGVMEVGLRFVMATASISALLLVMKQFHYFKQLLTAIFVCEDLIVPLAAITDGGLYHYMIVNHVTYGEMSSVLVTEIVTGLLAFLYVVWYLLIVAYILRKFFQFDFWTSFILAFSYFVLTYGVPMMLFDM